MVFTIKYKSKICSFYTAEQPGSGVITFFIYSTSCPGELPFAACFDTYKGYFVFLSSPPVPEAFCANFQKLVPAGTLEHTNLVWINATDPDTALESDLTIMEIGEEGIQQNDVTATWGKYSISIPQGSKIKAEKQEYIEGLSWSAPLTDIYPHPQPFFLPFERENRGMLITRASISDFSDNPHTGWDVGFRYFMPAAGAKEIVSQYYPLFHPEENRNILFKLYWDLTSSKRTKMEFEQLSFIMEPVPERIGGHRLRMPGQPQRIRTWLRTDMGLTVYLDPVNDKTVPGKGAKLVLAGLPDNDYYWTPEGCFELSLDKDAKKLTSYYLLCGLSGVETMSFLPKTDQQHGDVLCFESGKPAFVYNFPGNKNAPRVPRDLYIPHSGMGADRSSYLNDTYKTSWLKIGSYTGVSAPPNYYYAQPSTSPLYGGGVGVSGAAAAYTFLPFFRPPSAVLNNTSASRSGVGFPMVPFAGAVSNEGTQKINSVTRSSSGFLSFFEEQVLAPSRTEQVMKTHTGVKKQLKAGTQDKTTYSTSPQGLLVKIGEQDFKWKKLMFACTPDDPEITGSVTPELSFENLGDQLQAAFQKKQLFLVVSLLPENDAKQFNNEVAIQGWPFRLDVPTSTSGDDYKNVLIFKFAAGAISDLIDTPAEWTSPQDFNKDAANVSQWLRKYIDKKEEKLFRKNRYNSQPSLYTHFKEIVESKTWTGVLALNVDINLEDFPDQVKGLVGGIDLERFNAHHLGIEVNQVVPDDVNGGLKFAGPSSLFGLIDYKGTTLPPAMPFDFKVDLLQVHFMNNAIADFRCNISLTVGQLFGEVVKFNPPPVQPCTINLTGTYEKHEGVATYSFLSDRNYTLSSVQGTVWNSITLSKVQFFTLSQRDKIVNSVFSFFGEMIFNDISTGKKAAFDLFSFDLLSFNGMQLLMDFNIPEKPVKKTVLNFNFDPSAITFNNSASTTRKTSLFENFPLDIKGMVSGDDKKLPAGKGYFKIKLPANLEIADEITSTWYAIRYDLDLGTPGALAEKAGFAASILACWTPFDPYEGTHIAAFLQLPGGSGLLQTTIQNVLTLSVANAEFLQQGTADKPIYRLSLNDIALKVLGFSIPPGGKTNASLFTNADQQGKKDSIGWYIAYNKK